jgi:EmrB/QacA subfamily drug resistance transporter
MTKTRNRWIGLVFISMAISLVIIDGTIVNTIFPSVIKSLALTSTDIQWVQESYVLVFASLLLVWGSLADRFGRRRMLVIGLTVFVLASVWAGTTDSAQAMILARIVQGLGGAMVLPTTLSLVNANFQGKERGIAFAVWGATIGGMVAIGPVLGGWLTTVDWSLDLGSVVIETWRWAFCVNLPLGAIVIAGLLYFINESKQAQREGGVDFVGALLSVVMFGTLVFGLIEGRVYGWWDQTKNIFAIGNFTWPADTISVIPVSLAISLVFGIIFVIWERAREKAHKNVLLDLGLFSIASFRNGSIAALIISMGEFGLLFAIPLWLQNVSGLNALSSGMVLLWLAGGAFLASAVGGALSGRISPVTAVRIGVALEMIGVLGIALGANTLDGWQGIAGYLFIYGIGVGLATAQLTGVIMVDVPMDRIGQASGSQSTVRQVGSALGIAVLGTALFTSTQAAVATNIESLSVFKGAPTAQVKVVSDSISNLVVDSAGAILPNLPKFLQTTGMPENIATDIQLQAREGFTEGVKATGWFAGGFLALGLLSTFFIGSRRKKEEKAAK